MAAPLHFISCAGRQCLPTIKFGASVTIINNLVRKYGIKHKRDGYQKHGKQSSKNVHIHQDQSEVFARYQQKLQEKQTKFGHRFESLKKEDTRLGKTIIKAKSSLDSETILLEGQRLISDAIFLGAELKSLYFCDEEILSNLSPSSLEGAEVFKIPYKDMKTWSGTTTPPGIMGVFRKPFQGEIVFDEGARLPLTLILDGVRDPGNAGTLIRTAAAVGCERILALKGCVDVWEPKVLRSGMGSHFAVPIFSNLTWSEVYSYVQTPAKVFLADSRKEEDVRSSFKNITLDQIDEASNMTESEDEESDSDDSDTKDRELIPENSPQSRLYSSLPFSVIPYSNMSLQTSAESSGGQIEEVALVLGNETTGLSPSARKFAYEYYGSFVTIPMNPAIDSLNTAVAGSIILYEIQRQLSIYQTSSEQ